jgi:methionyl-tRNA synthetase
MYKSMKPAKFYLYRHIIALTFLIILGLRFGKMRGVLIVIVVYLALNMDALKWFYFKYFRGKDG